MGLLEGSVVQQLFRNVNGMELRPYLIGDVKYALATQVIVPYAGTLLPALQDKINYYLSSSCMDVERAIGHMKGRWALLRFIINVRKASRASYLFSAAVILHNFCEGRNKRYIWEEKYETTTLARLMAEILAARPIADLSHDAPIIREHLAQYLSSVNR